MNINGHKNGASHNTMGPAREGNSRAILQCAQGLECPGHIRDEISGQKNSKNNLGGECQK